MAEVHLLKALLVFLDFTPTETRIPRIHLRLSRKRAFGHVIAHGRREILKRLSCLYFKGWMPQNRFPRREWLNSCRAWIIACNKPAENSFSTSISRTSNKQPRS